MPIPYIPASAPFTAEQRAWLNGYLAGMFADANLGEPGTAPDATPTKPLLVMYGSQTGSAERLAKSLAKEAAQHGFAAKVIEANAYTSIDLTNESSLAIITSTWGDGDAPDNATAFWSHLSSDQAPKLENLNFSVLALGDKNYADFCGAGRKFDERLEKLGAKRVHPRADCDTDYEAAAKAWMQAVLPAMQTASGDTVLVTPDVAVKTKTETSVSALAVEAKTAGYNRNNPFPARLITNRTLNKPGSAKDTRHFEISLEGYGLSYEVGDALGVMPTNCPALVNEILAALGCDGEEAVKDPAGKETSLRHALHACYAVSQPPNSFVQAVAERGGDAELKSLLDPAKKAELDKWLYGREVIDLLLRTPKGTFAPAELVGFLRKLQPRLYSISSSPKAHPGEVHLTVGAVRYEAHGRQRRGVCSAFLADRVELGQTPVPVFVQTSHGFRLPVSGDTPIIMIGPGTGIAPFRAFLEERRATEAKGMSWLFFGDQQRSLDFLYEEELTAMQKEGALTRFDLAFSRDQKEKVYVQNRMLENATELWKWLEDGAHFYVCGDAKRMAKDVDAALWEIIQKVGGKTAEQAAEYMANLKTEKRYQRDVY